MDHDLISTSFLQGMLRIDRQMECAMARFGGYVITFAAVTALTGCGTGAAETSFQTKPANFASLAPKQSTANPVRIPDAPKAAPVAKPSPAIQIKTEDTEPPK